MTNLMLRNPVGDVLPLFTGRMNRFFDPLWSSPFDSGTVFDQLAGPAVTIYETNDEYCYLAELPGWTRDQVSINFENGVLTVSGQRQLPQDARKYHRVEGFYGQFTRSFTVPGSVDADKVEAEFKEGLLTIHLPKNEQAKPRQIEVKMLQ